MEVNEAVRQLRSDLAWSQQKFATEMGLSIRAVVNYERDRAPNPKSLARLEALAEAHGLVDLAYVFTRALGDQLGTGRAYRGPLNSDENLQRRAFDRCVIEHPQSKDAKRIVAILKPYIQQVDKEDRAAYAVLRQQDAKLKGQ